MNKYVRILIIAISVIAIGAGIYLLWRILISPAGVGKNKEAAQGENTLPVVFIPKAISDDTVFDYWINKKTGEIYYVKEDGQIYKISKNGAKEDTGSRATGNLSYLKPSDDGSRILVAFGYPQNPAFAVYDTAQKSWKALPAGATAAAWDPQSNNRLAYLKDGGNASRLNTITLSDGKSKEILRLTQKDLDLEWVSPDVIYFKERPSAQAPSSIWTYNLKSQTIKTLASEEPGLTVKWDSKGANGIKGTGVSLSLIDSNNRILSAIDLKTLPTKCVFGISEIYCAAPSGQISFNDFPDAYLKKAAKTQDDIYVLPLVGLNKQPALSKIKIFDSGISEQSFDAERLEVQNRQLIFINRIDKKLYGLSL